MPAASQVLEHLRRTAPEPGMVLPDYDGYFTGHVSQLIWRNFGIPDRAPECMQGLLDRSYRRVVLLILDAFGWNLLQAWKDELPSLQRLCERASVLPLTTTFPSTTTVALTAIYTGLTPAEHTITGHYVFLREAGGIVDVLRFSPMHDPRREVYAERGVDVHDWFPMYTVFEPLKKRGLKALSITRGIFTNTALGWLHHVGADVVGYLTGADMVTRLCRSLRDDPRDGLTVVYWDVVDMLSHEYGPFSREVRSAIDQVFYSLEREVFDGLSAAEREDTLLLMTADHGQIDCPAADGTYLAEHPDLCRQLMLPPTGQSRAAYLYAHQGDSAELEAAMRHFEDRFIVRRSEDVLQAGLFGPAEHAHRIRQRVGDVIAIGRGPYQLLGPEIVRGQVRMKGRHGSLTENEMLVPLLIAPL